MTFQDRIRYAYDIIQCFTLRNTIALKRAMWNVQYIDCVEYSKKDRRIRENISKSSVPDIRVV